METVRKPIFRILYTDKDITKDVSVYLVKIAYTDNVEGETDEIEIVLSDENDLWKNDWYPSKGDRIKLQMGYDNDICDCGEFTIDEMELQFPPDIITIRGVASWVTSAIRTKRMFAYDGQTLEQIAQKICDRYGLTLQGKFYTVRIARSTQNRETDLEYLKRISQAYGYMFSIRGKLMIFTSVYDIESSRAVLEIDKTEIKKGNIIDKTSETFASARASYHNPANKTLVTTDNKENLDGFTGTYIKDVLEVRVKAENTQQAGMIAKAALHRANSLQQSGSFTMEGNPLLVAGVNIELTGIGGVSGKYHIVKSKHVMSKSNGYTTTCDIKRVGKIEKAKNLPKKPKKAKAVSYTVVK